MFSRDLVWNWYTFALFFVVSIAVVVIYMPRRAHFWIKLVISCLVLAGFVTLWRGVVYNHRENWSQVYSFLEYLIPYFIALAGVLWCFDCKPVSAAFCVTCGYCMQHISQRVYFVFAIASSVSWPLPVLYTIRVLITAAVCAAVYFWSVRKNKQAYRDIRIDSPIQLFVTTFAIAAIILIDLLFPSFIGTGDSSKALMSCVYSLSGICAVVTLLLELNLLSKKHITDSLEHIQTLLNEQRQQYDQEKTNVEMINLKCHDIRHQIRSMAGEMDAEAINELSNAINMYDSNIKTGNEAIDIVLAKQSLHCRKNDIRLSCLIDGTKLAYIPAHELYALFGNAIENAANAAEKLPAEKRIISITETAAGSFLNISVTNFFNGELTFDNGLPTSKIENHGFGIRSMQLIVEQHGGRLSVQTRGELFVLNIFLPLSDAAKM